MSADRSAVSQETTDVSGKGKGKQAEEPQQYDMMDADESESEESGVEEQPEEADEDNMEEINLDNIVSGRTRGKQIDWVEAEQKSKQAGDELDDEDDDDDEDFEDPEDEDKMQE